MVLWTKVWGWRHRVLLDIVEFEDRHRANLLSNPVWFCFVWKLSCEYSFAKFVAFVLFAASNIGNAISWRS